MALNMMQANFRQTCMVIFTRSDKIKKLLVGPA